CPDAQRRRRLSGSRLAYGDVSDRESGAEKCGPAVCLVIGRGRLPRRGDGQLSASESIVINASRGDYSAAWGIAADVGSSAGAKLSARAIAQACANRASPPPDRSSPGFGK